MERKYQIVYIWSFIIISGIVLLLLYTPIGGELHRATSSEQYRYNTAPGVNYDTQIGRFSGANSSGTNYGGGTPSAYVSPNMKSGNISYNGSTAASNQSFNSGNGSAGLSGIGISKTKTASSGASGGLGGITAPIGGGSSSSVSSGGGMSTPFAAANTGTSVMQKAGEEATAGDDELDPGDDPNGNPLPLGNDLLVLFSIAAIFSGYKFFRK